MSAAEGLPPVEGDDRPLDRASVDRRKISKRPPAAFGVGDEVRMRRNTREPFKFEMKVVKKIFNEDRNGWDYAVQNDDGIMFEREVPETDLK